MTLEEAIKNFEQEIGEFEGLKKIHAVTNEDYEYIEKARQLAEWLKELKERREKDVPDINVGSNGDAIYRQDAIDAVDKLSDEPIGYLEAAIDALVDLPSVQPDQKKGRWLNIHESEKWECSECGRMMWFSPRLGVKPSDYRFCPNCGADMRGEQDG